MKNNSKRFVQIVAVIILLLLIGGTLYRFTAPKVKVPLSITPTSTPSPTLDPALDWKTYDNPSLGFQINYPSFLKIIRESNNEIERKTKFLGGGYKVCIYLVKNIGNFTLDNFKYHDTSPVKKTTLDGIPANMYASDNYCEDDPTCASVAYFSIKGSEMYFVVFFGDLKMSDVENQILSTFKFIN